MEVEYSGPKGDIPIVRYFATGEKGYADPLIGKGHMQPGDSFVIVAEKDWERLCQEGQELGGEDES